MKKITKIDIIAKPKVEKKLLRVAAYARVSTDSDEQLLSLAVQKQHYENYIQSNPNWQYVGLYFDEGISGTKMDKREALKKLLEDCRQRKIDRVITKSISRLARNTVDCLEIVRELTSLKVYLYFEKENIDTEHMSSELMLSILSSIAESESHSISENSKWSIKRRFEDGSYVISRPSYGYENQDKKMIIVPSEAEIVREIFKMALSGMGGYRIAKELNKRHVPTKRKGKWHDTTVNSILKNEAYIGDVILQKTYTDDHFNRHTNHGEKGQYKISNHHEPIISHEDFERVQAVIQQRKVAQNIDSTSGKCQNRYAFSGRLYCGECQGKLKRRIHYIRGSKTITWKCKSHLQDVTRCSLKDVLDEHIQQAFLQMLNKLLVGYTQVLDPLVKELREMNSKAKLEKVLEVENKIEKLEEQSEVLTRLLNSGYIEPDNFYIESNQLKKEIKELDEEKTILSSNLTGNLSHINEVQKLKRFLEKRGSFTQFHDEEFLDLVDSIVIQNRRQFVFYLKCGLRLSERVEKA